ncbi:hypothetical protein [Alloyangia pacifica]|uniref:hypothetical protein n=1 Tax=Alloyangia pacifica TaxID=311180 RepID=UPI00115F7A5A|nr:hypothetical protein [Alloyangia pacifica]
MKLEFSAGLSWLGKARELMKASRFTAAQKAFILKQAEQGTPVAKTWRKTGTSEAANFTLQKGAAPAAG